MSEFEEKVKNLMSTRDDRSCSYDGSSDEYASAFFQNIGTGMLMLVLFTSILLLLLIMGFVKAFCGFCSPACGMFGMSVLVDLPRPLRRYHEHELKDLPVKYDVGGWPVHPQTGKRTIRPLSFKTEFCMNVVFFITYPVIMMARLVSWCCFKTYDEERLMDMEPGPTNTVVFADYPAKQSRMFSDPCGNKTTPCTSPDCTCKCSDVYKDGEVTAEEEDTMYVLEQMNHSQRSLTTAPMIEEVAAMPSKKTSRLKTVKQPKGNRKAL